MGDWGDALPGWKWVEIALEGQPRFYNELHVVVVRDKQET